MIIVLGDKDIYKFEFNKVLYDIGNIYTIYKINEGKEIVGLYIEFNDELKEKIGKNGKIVVIDTNYRERLKKIAEILKSIYGGDKNE